MVSELMKFILKNNKFILFFLSIFVFVGFLFSLKLLIFRPYELVINDAEVANVFWQLHTIQWGVPFKNHLPAISFNFIFSVILKKLILLNLDFQIIVSFLRLFIILSFIAFFILFLIKFLKKNLLNSFLISIIIFTFPITFFNSAFYSTELYLFFFSFICWYLIFLQIKNKTTSNFYTIVLAISLVMAMDMKSAVALPILIYFNLALIYLSKSFVKAIINILKFNFIFFILYFSLNIILFSDLIYVFSRLNRMISVSYIIIFCFLSFIILNLTKNKTKKFFFNISLNFSLTILVFLFFFFYLYVKEFSQYNEDMKVSFFSLLNLVNFLNLSRYLIVIMPIVFFIQIKKETILDHLLNKKKLSFFLILFFSLINFKVFSYINSLSSNYDNIIENKIEENTILIDQNGIYNSKYKFWINGNRRFGNNMVSYDFLKENKKFNLNNIYKIKEFKKLEDKLYVKKNIDNVRENKSKIKFEVMTYQNDKKFNFPFFKRIKWKARLPENFCVNFNKKLKYKNNIYIIDNFLKIYPNYKSLYLNEINITEDILKRCKIKFVKKYNNFLSYAF